MEATLSRPPATWQVLPQKRARRPAARPKQALTVPPLPKRPQPFRQSLGTVSAAVGVGTAAVRVGVIATAMPRSQQRQRPTSWIRCRSNLPQPQSRSELVESSQRMEDIASGAASNSSHSSRSKHDEGSCSVCCRRTSFRGLRLACSGSTSVGGQKHTAAPAPRNQQRGRGPRRPPRFRQAAAAGSGNRAPAHRSVWNPLRSSHSLLRSASETASSKPAGNEPSWQPKTKAWQRLHRARLPVAGLAGIRDPLVQIGPAGTRRNPLDTSLLTHCDLRH